MGVYGQEFLKLLIKRANGNVTGSELVAWASSAIEQNLDSPNLRILASLPSTAWLSDVEPYFDRSLNELTITVPEKEQLYRDYARIIAGKILANEISPFVGARIIEKEILLPLGHPSDMMAWCFLHGGLGPDENSHKTLSEEELVEKIRRQAAIVVEGKANKKAVIIGGGIGGLCAAIALRQKGVDATVFERAAELKEVGAGLSLWVNAIKALNKIGMGEALKTLSIPQTNGGVLNAQGDILSSAKRHNANGDEETLVIVLHRAELLGALLQKLGAENVTLNAECTGFEQDESGVTARFADGRTVRGSFLVGADGINSIIRAGLFGRQKPRYSGYTAWRAVTEFTHPFLKHGASESWGKGTRFGIVPMSRNRVYWFATRNAPEGEAEAPQGRKRELLNLFRGWHEPVEALIEATPEDAILRNDIVDREPLQQWTKERVTLLGDAAHPMTPNLGQGACQAIEDAVVLADCIAATETVEGALRAYEARRLERANKVVSQSHRIGRLVQNDNALVCKLRNAMVRLTPASMQMKQLNWIIEYEA